MDRAKKLKEIRSRQSTQVVKVVKGDKGDKGIPGLNGQDGYTPVKDVDYYDGKDGDNGLRGVMGMTGDPGPQGVRGLRGLPGEKGIKGDKGLIWQSDWDVNASYVKDDIVYYRGSSYVCTLVHKSTWDTAPDGNSGSIYWHLVAKAGSDGVGGAASGGTSFVLGDHTTDELPVGTTNLYSQWTRINSGVYDYIEPKTTTDILLVGNDINATGLASFESLGKPTAIFSNDLGLNFYLNQTASDGGFAFGGLFASVRARGTTNAPTAVTAGDYLGGVAGIGYDGTHYSASGTGHLVPGLWQVVTGTVSGGVMERNIYIGGLTTPAIGFDTNTSLITHSYPSLLTNTFINATNNINNRFLINNYISANAAAEAQLTASGDSRTPLVLQAFSPTQTANLEEWQSSAGSILARIDAVGNVTGKGYFQNVKTVTTDSILSDDSVILVNAVGGNKTETLPTAVGIQGRTYTIKKIDATTNTVTIATTSAQTIDGSTTAVISVSNVAITVISDNANWYII